MSAALTEPRPSPLASLLFFLSGGTALAYQVVWFKRFSHLWGNSSLAMAAVVAGFLLGLGVGARLLSGFADRTRAPLFWYGVFELGIASLALAVPGELAAWQRWTAPLYEPLLAWPALATLLRFAVSALVLGPPCLLMGATLPLLVRQFSSQGLGRATGWFYAINTAGAATGCYLTGFHLLPSFGLARTHLGAVLLNAFVGALAVIAGWRHRPSRARESDGGRADARTPEVPVRVRLAPGLALAAAAVGAGALLLQMSWARQLALILGGTTYAFSAVVMMVLVGIGIGSALLRTAFREPTRALDWVFGATLALVLGVTLGQLALPTLAARVGELRAERASEAFNARLCVAVSAALELVPSIASGLLFPLLVQLTGVSQAGAGRAVGRVYSWNTVGTTLGAIATSWWLFPSIGVGGAVLLAVGCYLGAAALLARSCHLRFGAARVGALALASVALVACTLSGDWYSLRLGQYLYGPGVVELLGPAERLFHEEGASCDVLVTRLDGHNHLRVNGKVDASTYAEDQLTQLGTAYLPRFLRPGARDVLLIGLGSGASAGASLLFPGTRRLDCVEIEPAVFEASRHFHEINHRPEDSERFELIVDDGRSHLLGTTRRYDLILTEPSNPWMAGVANLFTREFYQAAQARLEPGGLLAQWIQTYALSIEEYALVTRTLLEIFPHVSLLVLTDGDTMLLASEVELWPTQEGLDRMQSVVQSVPAIEQDLGTYFHSTDVRSLLYRHLLVGGARLRSWAEGLGTGVHTDWNMRLEFDAPLHLFLPQAPGLRPVTAACLEATGKSWFRESSARLGCGPQQWLAGLRLVQLLEEWQAQELAKEALEAGLAFAPGHPELLAEGLLLSELQGEPGWWQLAQQLVENAPQAANRLGVSLGQRAQLELAAELFVHLLARSPDSVTLLVNLATIRVDQERLEPARALLERALALDPGDEGALTLRASLPR